MDAKQYYADKDWHLYPRGFNFNALESIQIEHNQLLNLQQELTISGNTLNILFLNRKCGFTDDVPENRSSSANRVLMEQMGSFFFTSIFNLL